MGKKTESDTKAATPAKVAAKTAAAPSVAVAPAAPVKKAAPKKAAPPKINSAPAISSDDIALRAYFIAEKRQAKGLPGDAHQDWLEAERQLLAEAKKPAKKAPAKKAVVL